MEPAYEQLKKEIQEYIRLRYDLLRLNVLEKTAGILALFLLILVVTVSVLAAFLYFSFALAFVLHEHGGLSLAAALCIIGGVFLLLSLLLYAFRKSLIINPLIRQLSRILFQDEEADTTEKTQEL